MGVTDLKSLSLEEICLTFERHQEYLTDMYRELIKETVTFFIFKVLNEFLTFFIFRKYIIVRVICRHLQLSIC